MLRDEVWATIAKPILEPVPVPCDPDQPDLFPEPWFRCVENTFLCFACIERRLGRQLKQEDLTTCPWNAGWIDAVDGPWIRAPEDDARIARGYTWDGDAWRHAETGELCWSVVGYDLNQQNFDHPDRRLLPHVALGGSSSASGTITTAYLPTNHSDADTK
jgi:hypothetical protein